MKKSGVQRDQMVRVVVALALIILAATKAHGSWLRRASACESYPSASAVFLGQVASSETLSDGSTHTRFDVKEAFKGVSATEAVAVSVPATMFEMAAVHLRSGERYLVFASQDAEQTLQISYLSIIPPSLAASEIRFLHAQREKDAPKTMLYGTLLQPMDDQHGEPLIATRIDAIGPSGSFQAVTDPDGYFEFRNIPAGEYQVTPELPDMLEASNSEVTIKEGGCAAVPLITVWNGRISGCARRSDGQPIADANVSLIDLARKRGEGTAERTDERGCYQFKHLESGRYVVGLLDMDDPSDDYPFPPMFYPNAVSPELARVLELAKGEKLDNVDFAVQDFEPRLPRVQGKRQANHILGAA